jgi:hypothetical protein
MLTKRHLTSLSNISVTPTPISGIDSKKLLLKPISHKTENHNLKTQDSQKIKKSLLITPKTQIFSSKNK